MATDHTPPFSDNPLPRDPRGRDERSIPPGSRGEPPRKQAKNLLQLLRAGEPTAISRYRTHYHDAISRTDADLVRKASLQRCLHVVAKELGFTRWSSEVESAWKAQQPPKIERVSNIIKAVRIDPFAPDGKIRTKPDGSEHWEWYATGALDRPAPVVLQPRLETEIANRLEQIYSRPDTQVPPDPLLSMLRSRTEDPPHTVQFCLYQNELLNAMRIWRHTAAIDDLDRRDLWAKVSRLTRVLQPRSWQRKESDWSEVIEALTLSHRALLLGNAASGKTWLLTQAKKSKELRGKSNDLVIWDEAKIPDPGIDPYFDSQPRDTIWTASMSPIYPWADWWSTVGIPYDLVILLDGAVGHGGFIAQEDPGCFGEK